LSKENTLLISGIHFTYKFIIPDTKTTLLISGIYFTYKFIISDTKTTQNKFFFCFWYFGQCSIGFNKLVIKTKIHAKTLFFGVWKTQHNFLALRHLAECTKIFFSFKFFFVFLEVLTKTGYFNTGFVFFRNDKKNRLRLNKTA